MKNNLLQYLLLGIVIIFISTSSNLTGQLVVSVSNIKSVEGELYIALYGDSISFMNTNKAVQKISIPVTSDILSFSFNDVAPGTYAISLFQDMNGNAILDTNDNGMPAESYGFSNNAKGKFGPPTFAKASFSISADTTFEIRLVNKSGK